MNLPYESYDNCSEISHQPHRSNSEEKIVEWRLNHYEDEEARRIEEDRLQNIIQICESYNEAEEARKRRNFSYNEGQRLLDNDKTPDSLPVPLDSSRPTIAACPSSHSVNSSSGNTSCKSVNTMTPHYVANAHKFSNYSSEENSSVEALTALLNEKLLIHGEIDDIKRQNYNDAEDEELKEFQRIEREIKLNELYRCLENVKKQISKVSQQPSYPPSSISTVDKDNSGAPLATCETDYSSSSEEDSSSKTTEKDNSRPVSKASNSIINRSFSPSSKASKDSVKSSSLSQASSISRNKRERQQRPLTVYLPSPQNDFDLVNHISNLGHDLQAFGHLIQITPVSCSGYLWKQSCRTENQWRKRFFHFDRNTKVLVYFRTIKSYMKGKKPRCGAYFEEIQDVYVDHNRSLTAKKSLSLTDGLRRKNKHTRHVFVVVTSRRSFILSSFIPEIMRIWIDVIFTGAEGHIGFQ